MTYTQQQEAWKRIHSNTSVQPNTDWRLHWDAKMHKPPQPSILGKSIAKGRAKAYGQVLEKSYIRSTVPIEKYFPRK